MQRHINKQIGYILMAHGTLEYMEDGSIEWNYSTGLGFEERKDSI